MSLRLLASLALAATLFVSGCSSDDDGNGTATTTPPDPTDTATTMPTTDPTDPTGNVTGEEYACTAVLGAIVGGGGIPPSVTVSGCTFINLEGEATYVSETIPAGCHSLYDSDADGMFDGTPTVGENYDADTTLAMGCDATNSAGSGTINILYLE